MQPFVNLGWCSLQARPSLLCYWCRARCRAARLGVENSGKRQKTTAVEHCNLPRRCACLCVFRPWYKSLEICVRKKKRKGFCTELIKLELKCGACGVGSGMSPPEGWIVNGETEREEERGVDPPQLRRQSWSTGWTVSSEHVTDSANTGA